jgi:inhibitor of cysteine peptidase
MYMRRLSLLAIGMIALIVSIGCGNSVITVTRTITETLEINEVISVESGQEFTVALESNPSTGYAWHETHDLTKLTFVEKVYQPKNPSTGIPIIVGGGGTDYFRFKALEKGKSIIVFVYVGPMTSSYGGGSKVIEVEAK